MKTPIPTSLPLLVANPKLIGELCNLIGSMPNIEMDTMGGKVFWETLESYEGWRIQRNKLTNHCRILNAQDRRVAWGSEAAMTSALKRLNEQYSSHSNLAATSLSVSAIDELAKAAELFKEGLLTQEEFEALKKSILAK